MDFEQFLKGAIVLAVVCIVWAIWYDLKIRKIKNLLMNQILSETTYLSGVQLIGVLSNYPKKYGYLDLREALNRLIQEGRVVTAWMYAGSSRVQEFRTTGFKKVKDTGGGKKSRNPRSVTASFQRPPNLS